MTAQARTTGRRRAALSPSPAPRDLRETAATISAASIGTPSMRGLEATIAIAALLSAVLLGFLR